jgi:hypothetical protein
VPTKRQVLGRYGEICVTKKWACPKCKSPFGKSAKGGEAPATGGEEPATEDKGRQCGEQHPRLLVGADGQKSKKQLGQVATTL